MIVTVTNCARCGQTHSIDFREFIGEPVEDPTGNWTHWGMCDVTDQPVLMRVETRHGDSHRDLPGPSETKAVDHIPGT